MMNTPYPVVLLILDGWGVANPSRGNAITLAYTPNFRSLVQNYPATIIHAAGEVVGLPWGEMGNSEVGHMNLGSGKVIYQNLPYINQTIADGRFFSNPAFLKAAEHVKKNKSKLHLLGLTSEGGVHSSLNHLYALLEYCQQQKIRDVYIHSFLDGRDTPHNSALDYINQLQLRLRSLGFGKIATLSGRFYAMDRDNHWDRISKCYSALVEGKADYLAEDPVQAIEDSYQRQVFDEEFIPTVITQQGKPIATIGENDAIIFFNFRSDRARELTKTFVLPSFDKFPAYRYIHNLYFVTMMEYEKNLPVTIAFIPDHITMPVARIVSEAGLRQIHIAETEKYAHVTFFFNGSQEEPFTNEDRVIIPSPHVVSYAQTPEMSAVQIKNKVIESINLGKHHFIIANFANADMVGHTGNLEAAKRAVSTIDRCLGEIEQAIMQTDGSLIVTADHGNAEAMLNLRTGEIDKEHSANPVPFILVGRQWQAKKVLWPVVPHNDLSRLCPTGVIADVAPTILHLLNLPPSPEMTSRSLINI